MSNQLIQSYQYSLTIVIVLLVLTMLMVYNHHGKIRQLELENESGINCGLEGYCGTNPYANYAKYQTELSDGTPGSRPGASGFDQTGAASCGAGGTGGGRSELFFGGHEAPVFYDIGNVELVRELRNRKTASQAVANRLAAQKIKDAAARLKYGGMSASERRAALATANEAHMLASGWTKRNGEWVPPVTEGAWSPVPEGAWAPVPGQVEKFDELDQIFGDH